MESNTSIQEALKAITSSLHKNEKVLTKLKPNTYQHDLMLRSIKAYHIAIELLQQDLHPAKAISCTKEEAMDAIDYFASSIQKVERILPKFTQGTSQHTLSIRRIKAFTLAIDRIKLHNVKNVMSSHQES